MTGKQRRPASSTRRAALPFDYSLDFDRIDFRVRLELYRVGRGEQGMLLVEPFKSELLPHWRFRTPDLARVSADTILGMFRDYLAAEGFVGADIARMFLRWSSPGRGATPTTRAVARGRRTGGATDARCCRRTSTR
jgi:hypothetical protein